jgi:hypothetical protein
VVAAAVVGQLGDFNTPISGSPPLLMEFKFLNSEKEKRTLRHESFFLFLSRLLLLYF